MAETMKTTQEGVWTPWAEALCRECHDSPVTAEQHPVKQVSWGHNHDDRRGFCSRCGHACWLRDDVAVLSRIHKALGGELQQTGGMCAGLAFRPATGARPFVFVTSMMAESHVEVGVYKSEDAYSDGEEPASWWTADSVREALPRLRTLLHDDVYACPHGVAEGDFCKGCDTQPSNDLGLLHLTLRGIRDGIALDRGFATEFDGRNPEDKARAERALLQAALAYYAEMHGSFSIGDTPEGPDAAEYYAAVPQPTAVKQ